MLTNTRWLTLFAPHCSQYALCMMYDLKLYFYCIFLTFMMSNPPSLLKHDVWTAFYALYCIFLRLAPCSPLPLEHIFYRTEHTIEEHLFRPAVSCQGLFSNVL